MAARPTGVHSSPLTVPAFRRLFGAQVLSLLGTGLTSVGLGLLAYDLAGSDAGAVLGTVLALKMVVNVVGAPILAGLLSRYPRRRVLVSLDLVRLLVVVGMAFITEVWQVYVAIAVLNAASAGFTPMFQAAIPEILDDEEQYTRALALSRTAYELENLLSPVVAAALLAVTSYSALFAANAAGFAASALLVGTTAALSARGAPSSGFPHGGRRMLRGIRLYLATPSLRGLLASTVAVAAASATVIVNTVVYVRDRFDGSEAEVAWALTACGAGAVLAALAVPRLIARVGDRTTMLAGGTLLAAALGASIGVQSFAGLAAVWAVLGAGQSLCQTPGGRLIQRSTRAEERAEVFAAQFSLSHACWLITYPLAGVVGATAGLRISAAVLCSVALVGVLVTALAWPARDDA